MNHTSLVIGLVGPIGAGKGTFNQLFTEIISPRTVTHFSASGLLRKTLADWDLPPTRGNLQRLAVIMNDGYGAATLSNAFRGPLGRCTTDFAVYDCIRWPADVALVRSFPRNVIVYINADQTTRWKRKCAQSNKAAERGISWEDFCASEQRANEAHIAEIGAKADFSMVNGGNLDEFRANINMLGNRCNHLRIE